MLLRTMATVIENTLKFAAILQDILLKIQVTKPHPCLHFKDVTLEAIRTYCSDSRSNLTQCGFKKNIQDDSEHLNGDLQGKKCIDHLVFSSCQRHLSCSAPSDNLPQPA